MGIWACVEVSTGVIACNIPATAPLFLNMIRKFKPKETSSPRGYALSQNVRNRYNKFSRSRINKYRYGKNAGFSTGGFSTINDHEANEDTVELAITAQPLGFSKNSRQNVLEVPPNGINVISRVEQSSHPRKDKSEI